MEPAKYENVDEVIAHARSLPDFPDKSVVIGRLETRNVNRYQEALMALNELVVKAESEDAGPGNSASKEQLQGLIDKIARLESADNLAE